MLFIQLFGSHHPDYMISLIISHNTQSYMYKYIHSDWLSIISENLWESVLKNGILLCEAVQHRDQKRQNIFSLCSAQVKHISYTFSKHAKGQVLSLPSFRAIPFYSVIYQFRCRNYIYRYTLFFNN